MVLEAFDFLPDDGGAKGPVRTYRRRKKPSKASQSKDELPARESPSKPCIGETVQNSESASQAFRNQVTGESMSATSPTRSDLADTTEGDGEAALPIFQDEENAIILDPKHSARQYHGDPFTGLQREIWRPGDGDGDKAVDYYDAAGPPPPLEKRRRFYQSHAGNGPVKRGVNEPPKYVILDDCAAYEVFASDIPRKHLADYWGHDFGGPGKIRARRPHRGRGAIGDPNVFGDDKFHFAQIGSKGERYYFTGERDYKAIIYRSSSGDDTAEVSVDPTAAAETGTPRGSASKRKAGSTPGTDAWKRPKYGHNQHTPKHLMVKNGAPSYRKTDTKRRERISRFLTRDPSPDMVFDKSSLYSSRTQHPPKKVARSIAAVEDAFRDAESLFDEGGDDEGTFIPSTEYDAMAAGGGLMQRGATSNEVGEGTLEHAGDVERDAYIEQLKLELENARQTIEKKDKEIDLLTKASNAASGKIVGAEKDGAGVGEVEGGGVE